MRKARSVFLLQFGLGALGAGVVAFALVATTGRVTWSVPPARELLEACRALLPNIGLADAATLALVTLSLVVVVRSVRSGARRLRASRRFLRRLQVVGDRHVLDARVIVFRHPSALAFCAGLIRPRLYVSTGSVDALRDDELQAVVAHERHHARQRDPLRVFVAGVLSDALFFVPALRPLADRYSALAELAADRAAVRANAGDPAPLANALLAFERSDPAVVGIAPERVDHLLGDGARWQLPLALVAWALTLIAAYAALALRVEAMGQSALNVPLLIAESCMLLMAFLPLAVFGGSMLGAGRLVQRLR